MGVLKTIVDEAIGMFVDDGMLALSSALLIVLVTAATLAGVPALWGGLVLLAGCIGILGWSVARAVKR